MKVREISREEMSEIYEGARTIYESLDTLDKQFKKISEFAKIEIAQTKHEIAKEELEGSSFDRSSSYSSSKILEKTDIQLNRKYDSNQTNILKELYLRQNHKELMEKLSQQLNLSELEYALENYPSKVNLWGFVWRFTRKKKKEEILTAVEKVEKLLNHYQAIEKEAAYKILPVLEKSPKQLWKNFAENKDSYYHELSILHQVNIASISKEDYLEQKMKEKKLSYFQNLALMSFQKKREVKERIKKLIHLENKEHLQKELQETSLDAFSQLYPDASLRLNLLAQNGIKTVEEMDQYPSFLSIPGIGHVTNERISSALDHYKEEVLKSLGFQFNVEEKRGHQTEILSHLYLMVNRRDLIKQMKQIELDFTYHLNYPTLLQDIHIRSEWALQQLAKNKRLLTEHDKNMLKLTDFVSRSMSTLREYQEESKKSSQLNKKELWSNFNANAADYYAILEREFGIGSSNVESTIKRSGLSDEIIEQIKQFELNETGLQATLRSWQDFGTKYALLQKKVLIGDEMGLGKTLISIAAMTHLMEEEGKTHFLVICPASIMTNWEREITKFSTLKVFRAHGNYRKGILNDWKKTGGVALTTYETSLLLDFDDLETLDMITVDEAHYIKNPNAKRTKGIRELTDKSTYAIYLTGTPLENKVGEMTELIRPLDLSIAQAIQKPRITLQANKYRKKIAPVYLRRTKEDVSLELPPLTQIEEWEEFGDEEFEEYKDAIASGKFMRMRRAAWTGGTRSKSPKLDRLVQLVNEAYENDNKVIVFTFFRDVITTVIDTLGFRAVEPIHGDVPINQRQEIIDEFRDSKTKNVLVAQINTAAHGLNIQFANTIIFCEPQIKPSLESQAVARAYRMGQVDNVFVYRLLTVNSVDEWMMEMLDNKQALFDQFADRSYLQEEWTGTEEEEKGTKNIPTKIINLEAERLNIKVVSDKKETKEVVEV